MPGRLHLEELLSLGEIGYVRGIEAKLAELAREDGLKPFADALGAYVQAFDMAGYTPFSKACPKRRRQTVTEASSLPLPARATPQGPGDDARATSSSSSTTARKRSAFSPMRWSNPAIPS